MMAPTAMTTMTRRTRWIHRLPIRWSRQVRGRGASLAGVPAVELEAISNMTQALFQWMPLSNEPCTYCNVLSARAYKKLGWHYESRKTFFATGPCPKCFAILAPGLTEDVAYSAWTAAT